MKKEMAAHSKKSWEILPFGVGMLVSLFAFVLTLRKVENFDIWWHVKVGEGIIRNLHIPLQETFSHTMAGTPWTPHEWFAEVLFYGVHFLGGVNALSLVTSILAALTACLCWLRGRHLGGGLWSLAIVIGWACLAARFRYMARPHIFFFLLAASLLFVLEHLQDKKPTLKSLSLYLLIPVLLFFWVNTHGSFPLGYAFVAVWAIRECFVQKNFWPVGVGVLSLLFVLANPGGVDTLLNMKDLFVKASLTNEILNEEFSSPGLNGYPYFWSFLGFSAILLVVTFKKKALGWLEVFTIVVTAVLAVTSVRFIAIFVIASVPYIAVRLNLLLRSKCLAEGSFFCKLPQRSWFGGILCLVLMVVAFFDAYNPSKAYEWGVGLDTKTVPVNAATFLDRSGLDSIRLYNNFEYGGYLTFRLFPRFKVARDGRAEIFAPLNNAFMVNTISEYQLLMNRFRFQIAVVPFEPSNGFEKIMRDDPFWSLVYWDDQALVYARKGEVPETFLAQWQYRYFSPFSLDYSYLQDPVREGQGAVVLNELRRAASTNPDSFKPWVYLGYVNSLMAKDQDAIDAYEHAVAINSVLGIGHYGLAGSLAELYLKLGERGKSLENLKKHLAVHKPRQKELHRFALMLYELKEYGEAEKYFSKYLDKSPEDAMALANYGFLLIDIRRFAQARELFQRSLDQQEEGPGGYGLALTYQQEGNCAKAIPLWKAFIKGHDGASQIVAQARQLLAQCGD